MPRSFLSDPRARKTLAWSAVLFLALLVSFFPIEESDDDWWHLKAGKLIFEGDLGWYDPDPFTESAKSRVWLNHEWLGEWLFYAAYQVAGLGGAVAFKSLIILFTFAVVFRSSLFLSRDSVASISSLLPPTIAILLAITCSQFTVYLRPPIYTFLLVAVFHWGILRSGGRPPGRSMTFVAFALMALWPNLHGGAILGCVILFLMGVGSLIEWARPKSDLSDRASSDVKGWLLKGGAVAAASLLNPYGYHLHLLTFEMMSRKWLTEIIYELGPPPFDLLWTLPLLLVPAAIGVARKGSWGERLVFLFLFWQGCSHVRHLPLLSIWAAPYAAAALSEPAKTTKIPIVALIGIVPLFLAINKEFYPGEIPLDFLSNSLFRYASVISFIGAAVFLFWDKRAWMSYLLSVAVAVGFVLVYAGDRPARFVRALGGEFWSDRDCPDKLVDFILEHDLQAPVILSRENYSGYLIWRLAPERMRTFTCSRFDLQGSVPRMELETLLWRFEEEWADPETGIRIPKFSELWNEKYQFRLVLIEKRSDRPDGTPFPLWTYLNNPESGFVPVASEGWPGRTYPDQEFTLFVRRGNTSDDLLTKLGRRVRYDR